MESLIERTVREVAGGAVFALQPAETQARIRALSDEEIRAAAARVFTRPQPGGVSQSGRLLLNPCLTVQWLEVFEELALPRDLRVFEPCAGGSEPVAFATEIYSGGRGEYTTVNLNRPLAGELRHRLAKAQMRALIVEDNAARAGAHLAPESVHAACFHHAINDLLQTAVSEPRGMDTRLVDWWASERQMIEWLGEEETSGRLYENAQPALMQAVRQAAELVVPGGYLLFDHWTWEGHRDLDWFPWRLFCDMIPLVRGWVSSSGLPLVEIEPGARDPQWWLWLRKQ